MRKLFFMIFCCLAALYSKSQDFDYGTPSQEELNLKSYPADTSADALVLAEFGEARILSLLETPLVFTYHVKIKLFNPSGFGEANVVIPLYLGGQGDETLEDIKGCTISMTGGRTIRTDLDPKKVYREKKTKTLELVKFTLPNLTEGCIIDYVYKIKTPNIYNYRSWTFQSDIPKLKSTYIAHIPAIYTYNVSLKGVLTLPEPKAELEVMCFNPGIGFHADCSKMTYEMKDIPAMVEEEYMTAPSNFRSAITFELADYKDYNGANHKVTREWADADRQMKSEQNFGAQLKRGGIFKSQIAAMRAANPDSLALAKAMVAFIQKTIKWNGAYAAFSSNGIAKAFENHTGNSADVNLSLTAALMEAGFDANAVLLSTRENGMINKIYPILSDFNYVIAGVNIKGTDYLLDATDPLLPFGLVPLRCINDQGRVMNPGKASYWIDIKASQKKSHTINMDLSLKESGKITGRIALYSSGYEAFSRRGQMRTFNSAEEYAEDLDEKMPKIRILKSAISNADSLDNTLAEIYDVEIDAYNNLDTRNFLFNPFFFSPVKENPFKLASRSYPVDLGAASVYRTVLSLEVPPGYELTGKPAAAAISLPLEGGKYISDSSVEGNKFRFSELIQLNKAVYLPDEYPFLKELFNRIVQTQLTDLIIQKTP